jgi:nitroreductase
VDAFLNRRSIRRYKADEVPQWMIDRLLQAAMYAPSAKNCQPWHFIVCDQRDILLNLSALHPYAAMLKEAPLCIVVCADLSLQAGPYYYLEDCAAATQNILLCAHELGLGSCWMGVSPVKERMDLLKAYFKLPPEIEVFSLIAVGWPNEEKKIPQDRYKKQRIHKNTWQETCL